MIETVYKVGDKEFKDLEEAKLYEAMTGFRMYDVFGSQTLDIYSTIYIITTDEAQTDYVKTKYNILLPGKYGLYMRVGHLEFVRVPNTVVEDLVKRFK